MPETVLIFSKRYLPGYKGGGPIRTLASMVQQLGDELRFRVVADDRDSGDRHSYPGVQLDAWQSVGKAQVRYLPPRRFTFTKLRRLIRETPHDILYLNSFFCYPATIKPLLLRRAGLLPPAPVVLAPRGEFSPGALRLKGLKKRLYIAFARGIGLCRDVVWQASSEHEAEHIREVFGDDPTIVIAPDLALPPAAAARAHREKKPGVLRIVFLSRIVPKKNLSAALEMLKGVTGEVEFDIYGPQEDTAYWERCQRIAAALPSSIRVQHRGLLPHEEVPRTLGRYQAFFMPTLGENFGHAILEAFLAGCPVVISDQTPWRNLEDSRAGWDLPLNEPQRFRAALQELVGMDQAEWSRWSKGAAEFGHRNLYDPEVLERNRRLFQVAVSQTP